MSNFFRDEYGDLTFVGFSLIFIFIFFVLYLISIPISKEVCERSGEIVADDYHYGFLEGCYYKINDQWITKANFNNVYAKQEIDLNIKNGGEE